MVPNFLTPDPDKAATQKDDEPSKILAPFGLKNNKKKFTG